MERYICIHGHFYQPPRENPWLETIELQESAYPYHDWNERITAECYQPNSASRIQNAEGCIEAIVNNYAKISFDFGPTLLKWMQDAEPEVYTAIVEADRQSRENFSGHGSAIAQAYNHMIMPLANRRDKYTQVAWGIADFEHRFGRSPEGMWLPETAVGLETLDILAERGIRFTILSPFQAGRVRPLLPGTKNIAAGNGNAAAAENEGWQDATGGRIDPTRAYLQKLPSGRNITLFFYDGPISQSVAFGPTLDTGENFANRLLGAFNDQRDWPQLVHIATDGETYGHHHRFGDMALAYAIHHIESNHLATITNYAEYLDKNPPTYEVEVVEDTAWSCTHGVERWASNCGCNSGGHAGWNQEWRTPLRAALDWLRDEMAPRYEEKANQYLRDPWAARDDYIQVILDRGGESRHKFFEKHATHPLSDAEQVQALKLLELQRHALLMYTSCGWFFDELSGLETVQVIQYAGRALQLANELLDSSLEPEFLHRLEQARSNIPEDGDGRKIFEKFVRPAEVDLKRVAAHYAVSSLFEAYGDVSRIYSFTVERGDFRRLESGAQRLALAHARFISDITRESENLGFGVLHFGDQNLSGGVSEFQGDEDYQALVKEATEAFERADISELLRSLDQHFARLTFSLESLFKDEQQKILNLILAPVLADARAAYDGIYERRAPLMRFLPSIGHPIPGELQVAAGFALNAELDEAIHGDPIDFEHIRALLDEARRLAVTLDNAGLGYKLSGLIEEQARLFQANPTDSAQLAKFDTLARLARQVPFDLNLWKSQNIYWDLLHTVYPEQQALAEQGSANALEWCKAFLALGDKLHIQVPELQLPAEGAPQPAKAGG